MSIPTLSIRLNTINDVKQFVHIVNQYPYDIDLISGRYIVDAKSIMGIFSLDLAKPIQVHIHQEECDELISALDQWRVRDN